MIKSIIVEDLQADAKTLKSLLREANLPIEIVAITTNVHDAVIAIQKHTPELVFLDIQLEGESGFELLKKIDTAKLDVIFTSQYNTYDNAVSALRTCAIDFLAKPIDTKALLDSIARLKENKLNNIERLTTLKKGLAAIDDYYKPIRIACGDSEIETEKSNVLYCESDNMKTQFFLLNEVHGTRKYFSSAGMKTWEACLCNSDFFRVHKCYVVNLNYVKELKEVKGEEFAVMTTEIRVPVSQRNKVEFRKVWKQFAKRRK